MQSLTVKEQVSVVRYPQTNSGRKPQNRGIPFGLEKNNKGRESICPMAGKKTIGWILVKIKNHPLWYYQ